MALIVHQYSVTDQYKVEPTWDFSSDGEIPAGRLVSLDSDGYVRLANDENPMALAGDALIESGKQSAFSADLVVSPSGRKISSQNRVSDAYDETLASGEMTVYTTGGVFFTDQYKTDDTWAVGDAVYSTATGTFTNTALDSDSRKVGYVLAVPTGYPSGVPGVDSPAVENSMSLGNFLKVQFNLS